MIRDLFNSITLFNSIKYIWQVKILFIFSKFKFWESLFPYFICMKHLYILIDFVNLFTYLHIIPNVVFDHNIKYGCSNAPFHCTSFPCSALIFLIWSTFYCHLIELLDWQRIFVQDTTWLHFHTLENLLFNTKRFN